MGLQPAPMGIPAPGQEEQKRPPGSAGRPIDRPRLWGSLGPIARIELSEDHRRPLLLSVTQGNGTPCKLDLYGQIRCLPRQRYAGASDPGRLKDPIQIRNRLRICSFPAHALPVLLVPPPRGPTTCTEGEADPQAQGNESGPTGSARQTRDRPPAPGGPGTHWGNTATRGQQTAPQQLPALPRIRSRTALEILPNPQSSAVLVLLMTAPLLLLCRTFVAPQFEIT